MLVLPLFDGVGARRDGSNFPKLEKHRYSGWPSRPRSAPQVCVCVCVKSDLCHSAVLQTVLQLQLVHPRGAQGPEADESSHVSAAAGPGRSSRLTCSSPVHARQVSPEVPSSVGGGHFDSVDHHRITLERHAGRA